MHLSDFEKTILRVSLMRFDDERLAMTELFYANLFAVDPGLRSMFGPDITGQTQKTMLELSAIVALLDDPHACRTMIEDLALRHVGYGVHEDHYPKVGAALMQTIQQVFGVSFPPEYYAAWRKAYSEMSRIMIAAAYPSEQDIAV